MAHGFGMKPLKSPAPIPVAWQEEPGASFVNPLSGAPLDRRERERLAAEKTAKAEATSPAKDSSAGEIPAAAEASSIAPHSEGAANSAKLPSEAPSATSTPADGVEAPCEAGSELEAVPGAEPEAQPVTESEAQPEPESERPSILTYNQELAEELEQQREQARQARSEALAEEGTYLPLREFCINGLGGTCNRCQIACPAGAISFDNKGYPVIDQDKCTRCGICAGICDGFTSTRITLRDLYDRILRVTSFADEVFLTCDENIFSDMNPADNVVVLPCLAALPPELYAKLLAQGVKLTIACDFSYCQNCLRAPGFGEPLYTAAIQQAETWTGRAVGIAPAPPEVTDFLAQAVNEGASRRELFDGLRGGFTSVASGQYRRKTSRELQEFYAMQERMRASVAADLNKDTSLNLRNGLLHKRMFPRREFLLEAANLDPELADTIAVTTCETDGSRCKLHGDCLKNCPTGARYLSQDGDLVFDPNYCIGCGLCVSACPEGACATCVKTITDLGEERLVRKAEPKPDQGPKVPLDAEA